MTAVFVTAVVLGTSTYFSVQNFARSAIRARLVDMGQIAAMLIDIDTHRKVRSPEHESSPEYASLLKVMREIRDRSEGIRFVYTYRRNEKGEIRFVVDAEEDPKDRASIDEIYDTPTPFMLRAFEKPYKTHVDDRFYTDKWGTFLSSYAPIVDEKGNLEAVLGLDMTADQVIAYESQHRWIVFWSTLTVCILGTAMGLIFSGMLSRPLLMLADDVDRVQHLDIDKRPQITSMITEVNQMKEAIENMKNGLRSFRKYVPAELVTELIQLGEEARLGMEKRELTIFFSDVADFTTISEALKPEELAENLSSYLKGTTRILLEHRGTVDKFIGDAVMAFWGAPTRTETHALQACRASLECQRWLAQWRVERNMPKHLAFVTRIGIQTGEAIVGNMGFEERLSYTAIGDNVNVASRLEGLNKVYDTTILVSENTYHLVKAEILGRRIDRVVVKGKSQGVDVYEVLTEHDRADEPTRSFVQRYEEGMNDYLAMKWESAISCFSGALELRPGDKPSKMLIERCRKLMAEPPGAGWTGAIVMREK